MRIARNGLMRTVVVIFLLSMAGVLLAGEDAVLDRGFQADAVYDTHDIDEVNQFNGNLTVHLPLGPRYRTNGSLEYGFTLYYNSNMWDYSDHDAVGSARTIHYYLNLWTPLGNDGHPDGGDLTGAEAYPSNTLNAGLGWIVSMGDLYRDSSGQFFWVAPDGGKHLFYTKLHEGSPAPATADIGYTRDGTYVRMSALNLHGYKYRVLQFPNGIRHRYRCVYRCDSAGGLQHYEFNQMADPFGNVLYVTQTPRPPSGQWVWTYIEATLKQDRTATGTDASSADVLYADSDVDDLTEVRRHEMVFEVDDIAYMRLKSLTVASPGGTLATYAFDYTTHDIYRPYGSTWWDATNMVYPVTSATDGKIRVKVLRTVTLPGDAGSWKFDYYNTQPDDPSTPYVDTQPDDPDTPWNDAEEPFLFKRDPSTPSAIWWYVSRYAGQLSSIIYPTGGKVQYRYTGRAFPKKQCYVPGGIRSSYVSVAVVKRQRYRVGAQGVFEPDPQGLWLYYGNTYRDVVAPNCNVPVEMISTAVDPLGNTTIAYFSVFLGYLGGDVAPWDRREYGMQVSKMDPPSGDRYISSQTYRCEQSQFTGAETQAVLNQRLRNIVKRLRPDGTPGTCYDSVRNSDGPLRTTYVKFEHSGFECDPNADASSCFAANRRLAREHVVFHDDGDSFADTDWTSFDGVGHYRTATMTGGGLLSSSPARVETVNYNPGSSETNLPTFWLFNSYDRKSWDENDVRALALFQFDARTGFLQSQRALAASGSNSNDPPQAGNDVLNTYIRYRDGADGTTVVSEENSYGGDRIPIGSTPEFRTLRKFRYGTESHFEHLTATTPVLRYDRTIDRSSGVVLSETTASGLTARYEYDVLGRPTKAFHTNGGSELPLSGEASLGYAYKPATGTSEGQLAKVTVSRPAGCSGSSCESQTTHTYDLYGRLFVTKGLLPDGSQSRLQRRYFANGWAMAVSTVGLDGGAVSEASSDQYDPFGRVGRLKNPAGQKTMELSYGGIRTVARQQFGIAFVGDGNDPTATANPITTEEYDRHGRMIKLSDRSDPRNTTEPALAVYGYDVMNHLVSVDLQGRNIAGAGLHQNRSFKYDNRGFLTSEFHPEIGSTVRYRYDSAGHMILRTVDGHDELRLTYSYDDAGRLTDVVGVAPNGSDRPYQHFAYFDDNDDACGGAGFAAGKLKSAARHNYISSPAETSKTIDVTVTDFFSYTSGPGWISRKATTVHSSDPGYSRSFTFSQQFTYSPLGLPSLVTYPSCAGCGSLVLPERRILNAYKAGFLTGVGGYVSKITYHPNGLFDEVQHTGNGNGVSDLQMNDANAMARPFALYTRGVISVDGTHSDNLNPDGRLKYEYDAVGNLMGVGTNADSADPEYRRYRYDSMSRLRRAFVGTQPMRNYQYDRWGNLLINDIDSNTNRLSSASYDGFGNLLSRGAYVYQYDALNAMTYVRSPLVERMFIYDANGERLGSIDNRVPPATPDDPPGRSETWTVRDSGNRVLRTVTNTNGTWAWDRDYIYRGSSLLASDGVEGRRHFHLDHLGTVRMATDDSNRVVSRHVYFPYGEEISDPDSDSERMKFAGHERDNLNPVPLGRDGDLDYMHARYYDPTLGKFYSVDPVVGRPGSSQSWNRYAYTLDNPLSMIDPSGRRPARVYGAVRDVEPGDVIVTTWKDGDGKKVVHVAIVGDITKGGFMKKPEALIYENAPVEGGMKDSKSHKPTLINSNDPKAGGSGGWNIDKVQVIGGANPAAENLGVVTNRRADGTPFTPEQVAAAVEKVGEVTYNQDAVGNIVTKSTDCAGFVDMVVDGLGGKVDGKDQYRRGKSILNWYDESEKQHPPQ